VKKQKILLKKLLSVSEQHWSSHHLILIIQLPRDDTSLSSSCRTNRPVVVAVVQWNNFSIPTIAQT